MRAGTLASIVLITVAAATVWWLDSLRTVDGPEPVPPTARHEPEHYFEQFRARSYETPGPPSSILRGERMVRFADDQTSEITAPDLDYHDPTGPPWNVTGNQGLISADGNRLDLAGNVHVTQFAPAQAPTYMVTPWLTVFLDQGMAETDAPVAMTGPDWNGTAIGMTAWLDDGQVHFHHDFRGYLEGRQ